VAIAGAFFCAEDLVCLGSQLVHALLADEHVRLDIGWSGRILDLLASLLFPALLGGLQGLQPGGLLGSVLEEREECVKLWFELLVSFVEGL
jgi:hypothetical protein